MKRIRHLSLALAAVLLLAGCSRMQVVQNMFEQQTSQESSEYEPPAAEESSEYEQPESSVDPEPFVPAGPSAAETAFAEAEALIPEFSMKYFLNQLTGEEMADFLALYRAVAAFEEQVEYPYAVSVEVNERLAQFLVYECPEVMQYDREATYTYYTSVDGLVTSRTIPYCMDREEYDRKYTETKAEIDRLYAEISPLTPEQQEQYIYQELISRSTYNRTAEDAENSYGLLISHAAKCDGISLTCKWLLDLCGVPNYILTGRLPDDSDGHAWNVINLNGSWYDLDITHDDLDSPYADQYIYGLYNVSDTLVRSQYDLRPAYLAYPLPGTADMSGSYHVQNGTYVYRDDDLYALFTDLLAQQYQAGDGSFSFQIEDPFQYNDFLTNTQSYIDEAAQAQQISYNVTWYSSDESQAIWCYVTF